MTIFPMHLKEANEIVKAIHRHHGPVVGYKFALGLSIPGSDYDVYIPEMIETPGTVGVAICGRPVARKLDNGRTLEVLRLAVLPGVQNACSALYGACARVAKEMGYLRIVTYTLETETGVSLKASGWKRDGETPGKSWSVPSRPRIDKHPICKKIRWIRELYTPSEVEASRRRQAK